MSPFKVAFITVISAGRITLFTNYAKVDNRSSYILNFAKIYLIYYGWTDFNSWESRISISSAFLRNLSIHFVVLFLLIVDGIRMLQNVKLKLLLTSYFFSKTDIDLTSVKSMPDQISSSMIHFMPRLPLITSVVPVWKDVLY